jgi:hypothetical protein
MSETNFFNLKLQHQAVKDFYSHHALSITLYKQSYNHLLYWEKRMEEIEKDRENNLDELLIYYRVTSKLFADMQDAFTNCLISYYAFSIAARANAEVMEEFKKLPADFSPVQKQFNDLIEGFEKYVSIIRNLI